MKIVSTTLTGNSEAIIGDALRSVVEWVDICVVVDTGVSDRSLEVAREIAGTKLVIEQFPWNDDFAQARNFALEAAARQGANWALTIDTDERIEPSGTELRAFLQKTKKDVVLLLDAARSYAKERAIRLPSTARYEGPTHEALVAPRLGKAVFPRAYFREVPKSPEQRRLKFERDLPVLSSYIAEHPEQSRWYYYLGETLKELGREREAISAYESCAALKGWEEESAWACFRAAQCHEALGEFEKMLEKCALGLAYHAGIAELAWYAGVAAARLGRARQAVYWARLAVTWGLHSGSGRSVPRISFRHLPGLFEGPFDILRHALRALGDSRGADEAEVAFSKAKAHREAFLNS